MNNWNYWGDRSYYHKELSDRAKGLKEEMEAAKQISKIILEKAKNYNSILDVGCGAGHFILSLEKNLKKEFNYYGVDITEQHIIDAKNIFKNKSNYQFEVGDIRNLQLNDKEFDVTISSNTIPHIPNVDIAIKELMRVTKSDVFIRMLVGDEVLITKKALSNEFNLDCEPKNFMYVNIFDELFLKNIVKDKGELCIYDDEFDTNKIMEHYEQHKKKAGANIATRIIDNKQFKGYLMLPWKIVHIKLYDKK